MKATKKFHFWITFMIFYWLLGIYCCFATLIFLLNEKLKKSIIFLACIDCFPAVMKSGVGFLFLPFISIFFLFFSTDSSSLSTSRFFYQYRSLKSGFCQNNILQASNEFFWIKNWIHIDWLSLEREIKHLLLSG